MTEPPIIVVYCEGLDDSAHDRFIMAAHQRTHSTPTAAPSAWVPLSQWNGVRLRNVEQRAVDKRPNAARVMWRRFRFRCDRCGLEERRSWDDRNVDDKIYAVFDDRWAHSADDISVRELVQEIGR